MRYPEMSDMVKAWFHFAVGDKVALVADDETVEGITTITGITPRGYYRLDNGDTYSPSGKCPNYDHWIYSSLAPIQKKRTRIEPLVLAEERVKSKERRLRAISAMLPSLSEEALDAIVDALYHRGIRMKWDGPS